MIPSAGTPHDPLHHRAAVAERKLPEGPATLDSTMTRRPGRSRPPQASLERLAEDIVFEVRGRPRYVWVDRMNPTDANLLVHVVSDILSRTDWGDRSPKIVRYVHLTDPRQVLADLSALAQTDPDAGGKFQPPWSALEAAVSRLAEAGATVLVLFDVGRYLAETTRGRGWQQFRHICEAAAAGGMALVALSSDSSHPDAQLFRSKFRPLPRGRPPTGPIGGAALIGDALFLMGREIASSAVAVIGRWTEPLLPRPRTATRNSTDGSRVYFAKRHDESPTVSGPASAGSGSDAPDPGSASNRRWRSRVDAMFPSASLRGPSGVPTQMGSRTNASRPRHAPARATTQHVTTMEVAL